MLFLEDTFNLSLEQIIDVLLDVNEQPIDLYIPMAGQCTYYTDENICLDYLQLAYAGQRFHAIAEQMTYVYEPPGPEYNNVLFTLWFSNIEGIAQVLFEMAALYADDPLEEVIDAHCKAVDAFGDQIRRAPEKFICQDFVRTYLEYWDKAG